MLIIQEGERFINSVPANMFQGMMAVGGDIKVTDRRLYFQPNELNVLGKPHEIRFEHITKVEKALNLGIIPNAIRVHTAAGSFKFVTMKRKFAYELISGAVEAFRAK